MVNIKILYVSKNSLETIKISKYLIFGTEKGKGIFFMGERRDLNPRIMESQSIALPLGYARRFKRLNFWAELDLNQRRQSQRIYNPPPLTTRASTLLI